MTGWQRVSVMIALLGGGVAMAMIGQIGLAGTLVGAAAGMAVPTRDRGRAMETTDEKTPPGGLKP